MTNISHIGGMSLNIRAMVTGVRDMLTAKTVEECGAAFITFVLNKDSRDYISPERAAVLVQQVPYSRTVGAFTNEDVDAVNQLISKVGLEYVELDGDEDAAYARQVSCPVIKRFRYGEDFSVDLANSYPAEMILLNIGHLTGAEEWRKLAEDISKVNKSVIVADNINRENVGWINKHLHPYAVSVSSDTEFDGDVKKIRGFFRRIGSRLAG